MNFSVATTNMKVIYDLKYKVLVLELKRFKIFYYKNNKDRVHNKIFNGNCSKTIVIIISLVKRLKIL